MGKVIYMFILLCTFLVCQAQFSAMTGVNICKCAEQLFKKRLLLVSDIQIFFCNPKAFFEFQSIVG